MLFPFFFVIITKRECEPAGISIEEEVANCMANIKSSAKRDLKSKELRAKNRAEKTALKSTVKKFEAAVNEGNNRAAGKGLLHKNNAARKKSAMAGKLNNLG